MVIATIVAYAEFRAFNPFITIVAYAGLRVNEIINVNVYCMHVLNHQNEKH